MSVQAIIYSKATGRVRRVLDPETNVPNVIAFLASAGAGTGEAVIVYTKQGNGADTLSAWQATVNAHTGLSPDTTQTDWLCAIDQNNNIVGWLIGDIACNDSSPLGALVSAPWGADNRWTYDGTSFTPPAVTVKP